MLLLEGHVSCGFAFNQEGRASETTAAIATTLHYRRMCSRIMGGFSHSADAHGDQDMITAIAITFSLTTSAVTWNRSFYADMLNNNDVTPFQGNDESGFQQGRTVSIQSNTVHV